MDFATIIGLLAGFGILTAALLMGNVPLQTLLNPEALLIVFGGTFTAILVGFRTQTLLDALGGLRGCFFRDRLNTADIIDYITDVARFVRAEGILAVQPLLASIEIPLLKKGLMLMMDNRTESFIRDSLSTEIEVAYREEMDHARVFEAAGGFAPTMGIIGAVIGLIHVVGAFHDPVQLGQGVASAFIATLYGVALSNLFLLPIAGKLRQRARDQWFQKTLILQGIASIQSGEHPMILEDKLKAFIKGVQIQSGASVLGGGSYGASGNYASAGNYAASGSSEYRHAENDETILRV